MVGADKLLTNTKDSSILKFPLFSRTPFSNARLLKNFPFQGYFFQTQSIISANFNVFRSQDLFSFGVLKIKHMAGFLQSKDFEILICWLLIRLVKLSCVSYITRGE